MPTYEYYVYLVEKYGNNSYRGIDLQKIDNDADINNEINITDFSKTSKFTSGIDSGFSTLNSQLGSSIGSCIRSNDYIIK